MGLLRVEKSRFEGGDVARRRGNFDFLKTNRTSEETNGQLEYSLVVDMSDFDPDEISVRVLGRTIVVEAKHDQEKDADGVTHRSYRGRYNIPEDCNPTTVTSELSGGGFLRVAAPKWQVVDKMDGLTVPITLSESRMMCNNLRA